MYFVRFLRGFRFWSRTCGSMSIWKITSSFHAPAFWRTRRGRDLPDAKTVLRSIPTAFVLSLLLTVPLIAQPSASVGSEPDSVAAGRALFLGTVRFQNGGPACSACHSVAGLAFPAGGTMGPDLTRGYSKMGPEGLNSALETLFFPAMTPLFRYRPLTLNERRDLAALFESVDRQQPATPTPAIVRDFAGRFLHPHRGNWSCGAAQGSIGTEGAPRKDTSSHGGQLMSWIRDLINPNARTWEEFYRNRWQHDRVVRSTHGVNCTGSCSWMIYVKDGIVTWEMQATDYPKLEAGLPGYEPRGCPRGIVFSWYIYSPLRIKYPYVRGVLLDAWREARSRHADPVEAWAEIMDNAAARRQYQAARGRGGFRRTSWDESLEIVAASLLYTAKKYGPDRVAGFSPIPAMSMLSYAAGSRFLQLFGAPLLSFYDLYADFPPASPETWGEKTDVAESADWYNSKYIVTTGSNLNMTRTPDVHFVAEARNNGSKLVVLSPDFSEVARYADWWIPVHSGMDAAFWMAVDHVILQEFHAARQVPYFVNYLKSFSDSPFLVALGQVGKGLHGGALPPCGTPRAICERGERRLEVSGLRCKDGRAAHAPRRHRKPLAGAEGAMESGTQRRSGWHGDRPAFEPSGEPRCRTPCDVCGFRQQPDVPAQRSSEVRRDGRWTDGGNYGL